MSSTVPRIALCLLAGFLAAACSSIPTAQPDRAALSARKAKAEKLTRNGALAAALVQWRIIESMDPGDPVAPKKRRAIESKIESRAKLRFEKGRQAVAKRRVNIARREFLAALAIDPSHEEAIEQLRIMELRRVRKNRPRVSTPYPQPNAVAVAKNPTPIEKAPAPKAKARAAPPPKIATAAKTNDRAAKKRTSESLRRAMGLAEKGAFLDSIAYFRKHLATFPDDTEAKRLLVSSQREVGIALYNNGKLRESLGHLEASAGSNKAVAAALADAKGRLAQAAYEKGIKAFSQDVGQAIAFWEETLDYDPTHARAKSYLSRAYKIQETLNSLVQ